MSGRRMASAAKEYATGAVLDMHESECVAPLQIVTSKAHCGCLLSVIKSIKSRSSQMLPVQCRPNYEKWVSGSHSLPPVSAVPPADQPCQHHAASSIALCAHPAAPVHVQDAESAAGAQDRAQVCETR